MDNNYFTILWCFFAIHQHLLLINMNWPQVYTCSYHPELHLPPYPIPLGCPQAPALSALIHASNLHWSSILHVVMYMFQCYSLKLSHPRLLPLSPNVCSLHLCLFCCPACRIVVTIFLFCEWCKGVIWLFSNGKLISPELLIDKNTHSPPRGYSTMNPLLTFYAICV